MAWYNSVAQAVVGSAHLHMLVHAQATKQDEGKLIEAPRQRPEGLFGD